MSEASPTLTISRPICNVDPSSVTQLESRFQQAAYAFSSAAMKSVKFNTSSQPTVALILGGELLSYHRVNNLPFDGEVINDLAEYLDDELPDSVDSPIEAITLPEAIYTMSEKKRWLNVGLDPILVDERQLVQSAIDSFYSDRPLRSDSWLEHEEMLSLRLASTSHFHADSLLDALGVVIGQNQQILPPVIVYGALDILEVNR